MGLMSELLLCVTLQCMLNKCIFLGITLHPPFVVVVLVYNIPLALCLGSQEQVCSSLRSMNLGDESHFLKMHSLF